MNSLGAGYCNKCSYLCVKNQTEDESEKNLSKSEDVLSFTGLDQKGLVPGF